MRARSQALDLSVLQFDTGTLTLRFLPCYCRHVPRHMTATPTGADPGFHILIVDDNEMGLLARKQVLRELGHRVTVVSSAREAIKRFTSEPFDLVVTDYKLPDMDGIEVIRRARAHKPEIPIVLISGFTHALGLNEASTGADVVLQKSATEVSQLIRAVNRLLRKNEPPEEARCGAEEERLGCEARRLTRPPPR